MYLLYCLLLLVAAFLAPALAVHPRLLLHSRTAVAIPFVSVAVILLAQGLLAAGGLYDRRMVLAVSAVITAVAASRVLQLLRRGPRFDWPPTHRYLVLFACLLGVYWAADLGTSGFDTNDEIYSWNLWALQHMQGREIDFFYTRAPYPQGFAILLSWCYQLLGDIELQLPLRALLALFPVALWSAVAVAPREATFANALRGVLLMLVLVAAIGRYFDEGLADPLMASSLVLAIFLFIQYRDAPGRRDLLALSVLCAAVALYTKQAALLWAMLSFPVILAASVARRRLPPLALIAGAVTFALGLAWVFGPGAGFQDNEGVIEAARQGRGALEQLLFAVVDRSSDQPLVPVLLGAAMIAVTRAREQRDIAWLFLVPSTVAWLLYGAYSLRLGIHLVALAALLLAVTAYAVPIRPLGTLLEKVERFIRPRWVGFTVFAALLVAVVSGQRAMDNIHDVGDSFSLYTAGPNTITKYFGKDADVVIAETYDQPDRLLWVPSNYIYGIYYAHTPMVRPKLLGPDDDGMRVLFDEIRQHRPDYLFDAGDRVSIGSGSQRLRKLAGTLCPFLFETRATPPNQYGYTLYRLRREDGLLERCGEQIGVQTEAPSGVR